MTRIDILLFLLSLTIAFVEIQGSAETCPSYKNIADFTKSCEITRIQNQVMDALWDIEYPELTDFGEDLVDVLYDMVDSRVPFWRRYALAVTEWIWAYFPDIDRNLNLCSYAEMINKTLIFIHEKDCKSILEAVDSSTKALTEAGFRLTENGIRNAGCDCRDISLSKPAKTKCYKDGFVYNIEEMWDVIGWEYPCILREIVIKLYHSCDRKDKIMALFATAVLSKYLAFLENEYNPEILYKTFVMLTPGEIPKCCCEHFIKEALDLSALIQENNVGLFKKCRESTNCKCHCDD